MMKRIVIGNVSSSVNTLRLSIEYQSTVPDSLGQLTRLETLRVCMCDGLTELPETFGQLTALRLFTVKTCFMLNRLPESLSQARNIRCINLHECHALTRLPESLGQLTFLSDLSICSCDKLSQLPDSIGLLENLQSVSILWCPNLTQLPTSMGQLEALPYISISWPCDIEFPAAECFKPSKMDRFRGSVSDGTGRDRCWRLLQEHGGVGWMGCRGRFGPCCWSMNDFKIDNSRSREWDSIGIISGM